MPICPEVHLHLKAASQSTPMWRRFHSHPNPPTNIVMVIVTVFIVIVIAMFWIILAIREKGAVTSSSAGAVATLRIIRWSLKIFTLGDPFASDDHPLMVAQDEHSRMMSAQDDYCLKWSGSDKVRLSFFFRIPNIYPSSQQPTNQSPWMTLISEVITRDMWRWNADSLDVHMMI